MVNCNDETINKSPLIRAACIFNIIYCFSDKRKCTTVMIFKINMLKKNPEVWDDEPRFNKKLQSN